MTDYNHASVVSRENGSFFAGGPTVNHDAAAGWRVGDNVFDSTSGAQYVCTDNTVGAAVWQPEGGKAGTVAAVAGAATLATIKGVVTSEALTTAAGVDYVLTLTNSLIKSGSVVFASAANGTNTTEGLAINRVQPANGSVVIHVRNTHASVALNGTIKVAFEIR